MTVEQVKGVHTIGMMVVVMSSLVKEYRVRRWYMVDRDGMGEVISFR
jgi:hypothetical protein